MLMRHQLPVYSPLTLGAIIGGIAGARDRSGAIESALLGRVRERYAARDAVLTNSGTSALTLVLDAARRCGRGTVALPAYGCFDIATAAIGAGVDVLLYDVSPDTLGPDPDSLRAALRGGARSILVAYLYGYPVDLAQVTALATEHDAILIEDAAQGAGGTWNGSPLGSFGVASVLSFGRGKGITGGAGGALLWRGEADASLGPMPRLDALAPGGARSILATTAQWVLARPSVYGVPASLPSLHLGDTVYKEPTVPLGASRFSAALVAQTWALAEAEVLHRKDTAAALIKTVSGAPGVRTPAAVNGGEPGYLRFPVVFDKSRSKVRSSRARRLGVMRGYPIPLNKLEQLKPALRNAAAVLPGASELARGLFTLPTHGLVDAEDVRRLLEWLRQ